MGHFYYQKSGGLRINACFDILKPNQVNNEGFPVFPSWCSLVYGLRIYCISKLIGVSSGQPKLKHFSL
jgi:hypothetical protein